MGASVPRRPLALALLALFCASLRPCSSATDWQRVSLGRVTHASLAGRHVRVATAQGVVASLSARTGDVEWRQVLAEAQTPSAVVFTSAAMVTHSAGLLQAWGIQDGTLLWEQPSASTRLDHTLLFSAAAQELLATLSGNVVQLHDAGDGRLVWETRVNASVADAQLSTLGVSADCDTLYVAGLAGAGTVAAVALQRATGELLSSGSATSTTPLSSPLLLLSPACAGASPQLLLAPSADGVQLAHAELARVAGGGERAVLQLVTLSSLMPSSEQMPKQPLRLRAHSAGLASLDFPSGITFALLHSATGAAEGTPLGAATASPQVLLQWSPAGAAVGVLNQASPPTTHVLALRTGEVAGSLLLEVTDAGSGMLAASETLSAPGDASPPLTAFLGTFSKRDGSRGFRCAAVAADHALSLLQQGQTAWLREEALAEVTQLLYLEPQSSGSGAAVGAHAASVPSGAGVAPWHSRLAAMLRSVVASGAPSQGVGAMSPAPRDWPRALPPQRDEHGFSRLLVALTAAGKVLALRSDDGRVVWSWTPPPGTAPPSTLLLWRSGAAPLLLLAGSAGDNATALAWLDGHSGAALGTASAPLAATRLVPLEAVDSEGRCVLLLWQRDGGRLALFPDTPEAAHAAAGALARTSLFWAGEASEDWAVRGFALAPGPAPTRALPSWSIALPGPPLALAARPPSDAVFSRTRVLGDRSTLYKYLNPNTLLVASASVGGASGLEVLLVDTVTGRVLYRVRHARGSGPVAAAAADNCFIYTYWDTAAQRTEVSVLELFDEGAGRGGGGLGAAVLGALFATSAPLPAASPDAALRGASSLAPPALRIMGQSYSLAAQTAGLGFTVTRRGLTSRQLLLATRAGRLLALDRRFLDPRRPTRPSAADREEGLVPYSEALPLLPGAYLTGAPRLARPRFLAAAPAALESACHVAALGLDLFYARAAPSRTFDTLGDNFSRPLLAVTLAALSLGAAAAAWAVKRDDLARQWR